MTQEIARVSLALIAGASIAAVSLYGLWLTVSRLPSSSRPKSIAFASLFARLALTLFVFYQFLDGGALAIFALVAGFVLARNFIIRRVVAA